MRFIRLVPLLLRMALWFLRQVPHVLGGISRLFLVPVAPKKEMAPMPDRPVAPASDGLPPLNPFVPTSEFRQALLARNPGLVVEPPKPIPRCQVIGFRIPDARYRQLKDLYLACGHISCHVVLKKDPHGRLIVPKKVPCHGCHQRRMQDFDPVRYIKALYGTDATFDSIPHGDGSAQAPRVVVSADTKAATVALDTGTATIAPEQPGVRPFCPARYQVRSGHYSL